MSETVPCKACGREIDSRRAALPITHGMCAECNAPNTSSYILAHAPIHETDAWSQGIKL